MTSCASPIPLHLVLCFLLAMMIVMEIHGFAPSSSCCTMAMIAPGNRIVEENPENHHRRRYHFGNIALAMASDDEPVATILSAKAQALQEKAEQLRAEIAALQDSKERVQESQRRELQAELDQQEAYMRHFSAEVPILKPDGSVVVEKVQFPPLISRNDDDHGNNEGQGSKICDFRSDILVCEAYLPLGMILGQEKTANAMIVVDEVLADSNGALAGIQEGDVLRACTSCKVEMEQPTWQLLVGGIGQPKTVRFMFGTDDQPLEIVLEALGANRMDPEQRPVVLVVERPRKDAAAI